MSYPKPEEMDFILKHRKDPQMVACQPMGGLVKVIMHMDSGPVTRQYRACDLIAQARKRGYHG